MPPVLMACASQRRGMLCSVSNERGLAEAQWPVLGVRDACFVKASMQPP